jgi:hypothetical protein
VCTLTILRPAPGALVVTMNRDEQRQRGPEEPPSFWPHSRLMAPRDSTSGGSWIAVNRAGMVAAILNGYRETDSAATAAQPPGGARPSRGRIIPQALLHEDREGADSWLAERFDPAAYASFTLVLADAGGTSAWTWDGDRLVREDPGRGPHLRTSSSWNAAEVLPRRHAAFERWWRRGAPFSGYLPTFHLEDFSGAPAFAPLMSRPESSTRSITQVSVRLGEAVLRYWPWPDGGAAAPAKVLTRAVVSAKPAEAPCRCIL